MRGPFLPRQALGELVLLMPTAAAGARDGDWGAWAPRWVALWRSVAHCAFWDRQWMALFARLAKHDTRGEGGTARCALGLLRPARACFPLGLALLCRLLQSPSCLASWGAGNSFC